MISNKNIKINDTTILSFQFNDNYVIIQIHTNDTYIELIKDHNEFNTTITELKNDFNITNINIKKINYWFYKNYKKIYPTSEYTTRYGRKIIFQS